MIWTVVSRLAAIATGGWVALAEPFAPDVNIAAVAVVCLVVLADELDLFPSTLGEKA